jgi:hypothetical protein
LINKNDETTIIKQPLKLTKVTLDQTYFQYEDKYFQPTKGIDMGSPISSTTAEITYYKRYVDSLIIFDQNKANENAIMNHMDNTHKYLGFKLTEEENNINY